MIAGVVHVRFDLVTNEATEDADITGFVRADMPCVPGLGELVNLLGWPMRVVDRGWSIGESGEGYQSYAFVRVTCVNWVSFLKEQFPDAHALKKLRGEC